jgi:hypothetical protein
MRAEFFPFENESAVRLIRILQGDSTDGWAVMMRPSSFHRVGVWGFKS